MDAPLRTRRRKQFMDSKPQTLNRAENHCSASSRGVVGEGKSSSSVPIDHGLASSTSGSTDDCQVFQSVKL